MQIKTHIIQRKFYFRCNHITETAGRFSTYYRPIIYTFLKQKRICFISHEVQLNWSLHFSLKTYLRNEKYFRIVETLCDFCINKYKFNSIVTSKWKLFIEQLVNHWNRCNCRPRICYSYVSGCWQCFGGNVVDKRNFYDDTHATNFVIRKFTQNFVNWLLISATTYQKQQQSYMLLVFSWEDFLTSTRTSVGLQVDGYNLNLSWISSCPL